MNTEAILISMSEACRLTSLSRTTINNKRALGDFPQPVSLGDKRIAFLKSEVLDWINTRIAQRHRAA